MHRVKCGPRPLTRFEVAVFVPEALYGIALDFSPSFGSEIGTKSRSDVLWRTIKSQNVPLGLD